MQYNCLVSLCAQSWTLELLALNCDLPCVFPQMSNHLSSTEEKHI